MDKVTVIIRNKIEKENLAKKFMGKDFYKKIDFWQSYLSKNQKRLNLYFRNF